MTAKEYKQTTDSLRKLVLHDIPGMTVIEHHGLCIGILATCYEHVPLDLQIAIAESLDAAKQMGMNIKPENITQTKAFSE